MCFLPLSSGGDNKTRVPSNICGDHGVCHSLPGGNFTCSCHGGYTGARCRDGMSGEEGGGGGLLGSNAGLFTGCSKARSALSFTLTNTL